MRGWKVTKGYTKTRAERLCGPVWDDGDRRFKACPELVEGSGNQRNAQDGRVRRCRKARSFGGRLRGLRTCHRNPPGWSVVGKFGATLAIWRFAGMSP